jgi:large subunit ribosomal protein L4
MLSELVRARIVSSCTRRSVEPRRRPRRSLLVAHLNSLALDDVLVIVEAFEEKLFLAARNLPNVAVPRRSPLESVTLARHDEGARRPVGAAQDARGDALQ